MEHLQVQNSQTSSFEALPQRNLFQTIKTIFNKRDYNTNKPTYVVVLETSTFVEKALGKEMFSIGKSKLADREPYFHNTWSDNLADMDECKDASELLETITEKAVTDNLEWDLKNTPVHPSQKIADQPKKGTSKKKKKKKKK